MGVLFTYSDYISRKEGIWSSFAQVNMASGFVISIRDGKCYILTAYHVVEDKDEISIDFPIMQNGWEMSSNTRSAKIVEFDKDIDYAILELDYDFPCTVVDTDDARYEEDVLHVGSPVNQLWCSKGFICRDLGPTIGHTASIFFGSSGGPLYNSSYKVVGMNVSMQGWQGMPVSFMSRAIKISTIKEHLGESANFYFK